MSVARMIVIRRFDVSTFRRFDVSTFRRFDVSGVSFFARRDREDQIPVAKALLPPSQRGELAVVCNNNRIGSYTARVASGQIAPKASPRAKSGGARETELREPQSGRFWAGTDRWTRSKKRATTESRFSDYERSDASTAVPSPLQDHRGTESGKHLTRPSRQTCRHCPPSKRESLSSGRSRIDFADGRYLITSSPSHFEFTATSLGLQVYTEAQQDRGTLYGADGQPIGIVSVFTLTHITWRDSNRNGVPDPGEVTANVSQFRVTCP
jgi:hypothetical protein